MPYLHPDDVLARAVAWAECQADPQAEPLGDAWDDGWDEAWREERVLARSWRRPGRSRASTSS